MGSKQLSLARSGGEHLAKQQAPAYTLGAPPGLVHAVASCDRAPSTTHRGKVSCFKLASVLLCRAALLRDGSSVWGEGT